MFSGGEKKYGTIFTRGAMDQPPPSLPAVGKDDSGVQDFLRLTASDMGDGEGPSRISPDGDVDVDVYVNVEAEGDVPSDNDGSNGDQSVAPADRRVSWKSAAVDGEPPVSRHYSYGESVTSEDMSKNSKSTTSEQRVGVGTGSKSSGSSSSRRRSSTQSSNGFWRSLTRKSDGWDEDDDDMSEIYDPDDMDGAPPWWDYVKLLASQTSRWFRSTMMTAFTSKGVAVPCLLLFALTVASGCLVVWGFDKAATYSRRQRAIAVAEQTDRLLSGVLENAFVPLFTMAAFVKQVELFEMLDSALGERCDPSTTDCSDSTSVPVMSGKEQTHRNLTGFYETDNGSATLTKFNNVAEDIVDHSALGRSLVAIQLAPKAVVSLTYTLLNCEDLNNDYCLNNTGALGHDLLNDPNHTAITRKAVLATDVVTAGPLTLVQGWEAVIALLPINFDNDTNHSMVVDGVDYPCWGLASVSFEPRLVNATTCNSLCCEQMLTTRPYWSKPAKL